MQIEDEREKLLKIIFETLHLNYPNGIPLVNLIECLTSIIIDAMIEKDIPLHTFIEFFNKNYNHYEK